MIFKLIASHTLPREYADDANDYIMPAATKFFCVSKFNGKYLIDTLLHWKSVDVGKKQLCLVGEVPRDAPAGWSPIYYIIVLFSEHQLYKKGKRREGTAHRLEIHCASDEEEKGL